MVVVIDVTSRLIAAPCGGAALLVLVLVLVLLVLVLLLLLLVLLLMQRLLRASHPVVGPRERLDTASRCTRRRDSRRRYRCYRRYHRRPSPRPRAGGKGEERARVSPGRDS